MIQIEESNPSFESCHKCIYSDDSEETCILRRCIHAVAQLNECYVPKQPPEIVRCKDCKHHGTNGYRLNCAVFCCTMPDDGFCSCGERRTDD